MKTRPHITYKHWWHRFIPSYRKNIKILDEVFGYDWKHGGEQALKEARFELITKGMAKIEDFLNN